VYAGRLTDDVFDRQILRVGAEIRDFSDHAGIPCLDLVPAFRARLAPRPDGTEPQPLYWKYDAHLNAAGYDAMAQEAAAWVLDRFPTAP